jgi:preprotein translocase subunit SecG
MMVIGMGLEAGVQSGILKSSGYFISPIGKANIIIAGIFFIVLIFMGITQSVEQKSLYPLWHQTGERLLSADTSLGQAVDDLLEGNHPAKPSGFFSKATPVWLWFYVKWWFQVASCIFMMYFFGWLLFGFWQAMNNESLIKNILLAFFSFILISIFMGMIVFNMSLAGKTLPDDKQLLFSKQMQSSYPFHGMVKFVTYFVNRDSLSRAYDWVQTPTGSILTGIPQNYNSSGNVSINNTSNVSGGI